MVKSSKTKYLKKPSSEISVHGRKRGKIILGLVRKAQRGLMGFSEEIDGGKRSCSDCKTTKTPLWRSGPGGPKSLCNACGIRFRKKSPTRKEPEKKKEKPASSSSSTTCSSGGSSASSPSGEGKGSNGGNQMRMDLRVRLMAFGKEVVLWQRPRSPVKRQRTSHQKLGEEEQAAVLLMDLSCGSVFA